MTPNVRVESSEPQAADPRLLAFVDELAALYAQLWHEGELDDMLIPNAEPENE